MNALDVLFPDKEVCLGQIEDIPFPNWLDNTKAVINAANRINAQIKTENDPTKAKHILTRLISDPRMEVVWRELYKTKRTDNKTTKEFMHPAFIKYSAHIAEYRRLAIELRKNGGWRNKTQARYWEMEAVLLEEDEYDPYLDQPWSDQDLAVQLFLWHVYACALSDPEHLSEIRREAIEFRANANQLRKLAASFHLLGKLKESRLLEAIASDSDCEASDLDSVDPRMDNPWIIVRETGDVELRTFVGSVGIVPIMLFRKPLYGTIARITNVIFYREDVTALRVRDLLRV